MFNIETYMNSLIDLLKQNYEIRLLYVGLQGSYIRNEADEESDIDVMVVLDNLSFKDLESYKNIIIKNGNSEKSCGFICGKLELLNWNPCEICHLVHTTKDYYGKLTELVPAYTMEDEINFIKLNLNNLYHNICHNYIHSSREKNIESLPDKYKSVFFILQNIHFLNTGDFIQTKQELYLKEENKKIMTKALELENQLMYDFDESYHILFEWCKNTITCNLSFP